MDRRFSAWVIAVAAGVAVFVLMARNTPEGRLRAAWSTLRRRPIEGRLASLGYVPRRVLRGNESEDVATQRLLSVVQRTAADCNEVSVAVDCAIASLIAGAPQRAITRFAALAESRPDDAVARSDLACAYLERGVRASDGSDFARALAAADEALDRQPGFAPALFNRARALDLLALADPANAAYARFVAIEPQGGWSDEARQRMHALSGAPTRERWQEALPRLRRAASRSDAAEVQAIVTAFPQESRAWGETEFLGDWAAAVERGDSAAASSHLRLASLTGDALLARNGDAMLRDSVAVIEHAANPQTVRTLAAGHRAYRDGRLAYSQRRVAEAIAELETVSRALRRVRSPLAAAAEYFRANALLDLNRTDESIAECERLQREVLPEYRALRAQLLWLEATARGTKGLLYDALTAYERALAEFTNLGETDNAQFMRAGIAWCDDFLGREPEAWRAQLELCRVLSATGNARTLQVALNAAADSEIRREQWAVARSLYRISAELAPRAQNPRATARTLVWLALASLRSGAPTATSDAIAARTAAAAVPDETLRRDATIDLTTAEATSIYRTRPAEAIRILDGPIAHARANALDFELAPLYVTRARAGALLHRTAEAIDDYERAIAIIEARRDSVGGVDSRDSYFGVNESVYREAIDLLDRAGFHDRALLVAERQRQWSDRGTSDVRAPAVADLAAQVPSNAIVAHYVALEDRLVIYVPGPRRTERFTANLSRARLAELTSELLAAASDDEVEKAHATGAALYDALIAPLESQLQGKDQLAVAGDALIARVPFAALYDSRSRRYLVERMAVVYTRSATTFAYDAPHDRTGIPRVVVVGDPAFDPARFPKLGRLEAAVEEARAIGELYAGAQVISGDAATRGHLIRELRQATIAHIAAHAVVNNRDPSLSSIVLASGDGNEASTLSVRELSTMDLSQLRIVVLAGCKTSLPGAGNGDLRSLAAAVHVAGARNVIGSLWDLQDEASRDFSIAFHRELQRGSSPAAALHEAQRHQMEISPDRLSAWAGIQLYGNGRM